MQCRPAGSSPDPSSSARVFPSALHASLSHTAAAASLDPSHVVVDGLEEESRQVAFSSVAGTPMTEAKDVKGREEKKKDKKPRSIARVQVMMHSKRSLKAKCSRFCSSFFRN